MFKKQIKLVGLVLVALLCFTDQASSTKLIHRNLKGLVEISKRIFVGRCLSVQEGAMEFDNGGKLYYTEYTFAVEKQLKGAVENTVTFRQLGLLNPRQLDETKAAFHRIVGMPVYRENQEYMLFLIGDSRLGLTSPVGLGQGAFSVEADDYGEKFVVNDILNRGLFKDLGASELEAMNLTAAQKELCLATKGRFVLDEFSAVVKKFVQHLQ